MTKHEKDAMKFICGRAVLISHSGSFSSCTQKLLTACICTGATVVCAIQSGVAEASIKLGAAMYHLARTGAIVTPVLNAIGYQQARFARTKRRTMHTFAISMLGIVVSVMLAACGGGSNSGSQNQSSDPAPDIAGQWDFFIVSNSGQLGFPNPVVANLQEQSTTNYFSTPATTLQFLMNPNGPPQLCAFAANDTGCNFPPNLYSGLVVNATLSNSASQWSATVQLPTGGTNIDSFTGVVNLASSPQIQGTTTVGSEDGVFVGIKMPSLSGTYSGNLSTTPIPSGQGLSNFPVTVSMTLSQDQSLNITGSATFSMSGCVQTFAFSNSAAVGGTAYLNGASGTTTIQMQLMQAWTPFAYDPGFNNGTWALDDPITGEALNAGQVRVFYTGSICGATGGTQGNGGQGTLTLQ